MGEGRSCGDPRGAGPGRGGVERCGSWPCAGGGAGPKRPAKGEGVAGRPRPLQARGASSSRALGPALSRQAAEGSNPGRAEPAPLNLGGPRWLWVSP